MNKKLPTILMLAVTFGFFIAVQTAFAAPSDIDFSFGSKMFDGFTFGKAVQQPDGKVLVAGYFDLITSQPQTYLIRVNTDGTRDSGFASGAPGRIDDFILQPDGKIIVVGRFSYGGGTCYSFNQCYGIMRLNANGSPDGTFKSGIYPNGSQFVNAVVIQPDGKLIIGGSFGNYCYGVYCSSAQPRGNLARINADGSLDTTFQDPQVSTAYTNEVDALALQPDGKVVISGKFDTVGGQPRTSIARINTDGTLDAGFQTPNITGNYTTVASVVVQPDGKILIGGSFSQIGGQSRSVARLNTDGTLDGTFQAPNYSGYSVSKILLQADGKIYLDGAFPAINNQTPTKARLNANGTIDTTFSLFGVNNLYGVTLQANGRLLVIGTFAPPLNNDTSIDYLVVREIALDRAVSAIAIQSNGKILIGGAFTSVTGKVRKVLARLNADGTLDASFANLNIVTVTSDPSISGLTKIAVQPDGKIIIIGSFSSVGGQPRLGIARLNADGTLDTNFQTPTFSTRYGNVGNLSDVILQPDGKILLGGYFDTVNTQNHKGIVRLNADGSLDATLQYGSFDSYIVSNVALQTDGKIIIVGQFNNTGAFTRTIERLNADGTHDNSFQGVDANQTAANNGGIKVVRVQPDGKVLIGGLFSLINGQARKYVARLNADGTLDATFQDPNFTGNNGITGGLTLQTDGKILISGDFYTVAGQRRVGLARLNADGSLDTTFGDLNMTYYPEKNALTVQRDGKILIGGSFQYVGQRVQPYISRLVGTPLAVTQNTLFDYDGDGKADVGVFRPTNSIWYLLQSTNGFSATPFGLSNDVIAPADFDGDGKTDIAVWRPSNGTWYILNSSTNTFSGAQFGLNGDVPAPADYDGDGKAELCVFRPSNGTWYTLNLKTNAFNAAQFGTAEDKPQAADYDGDGKTDYAVFRPSNGVWYVLRSTQGFAAAQFGSSGDKAVAGDYDGDGKADYAVYRPSSGIWYVLKSRDGFAAAQFGIDTDLPTPADYDGDGKTDFAVFRPSNGTWYELRSTQGFSAVQFGSNGDKPASNAFVGQ